MKKLTITIALTALFSLSVFANPVDVKTAQKAATTFLQNNGAKSTQLTDLSKAAGFANLYIFTTENSFVVMAADDCVQPILGYSLTNKFVADDMPENLHWWLEGYSNGIQYIIDNQTKASSKVTKQWKDLASGKPDAAKATTIVDALVQTMWDQESPYNNNCPKSGNKNTVTGCVATAMAQIMKYWNYPTHGIGSHSYAWNNQTLCADFNATNYDWDNMTNTYGSSSTQIEKDAVATLMYHCGVSVSMNYGTVESGALTLDVASALRDYFNYSPNITYKFRSDYEDSEWIAMLKAELDAEQPRPLQYRGSMVGGSGGHSFVCDGYDNEDLFHFNWGWGDKNNGFFSLDSLNTINGNFTDKQAAIFGIEPVYCTAEAPTELEYSINGRQATLNWAAAEGAISYNIYRNGSLIGNSLSTTYIDSNAPFGSNEYYVRSVDASGNLSFTSNSVTVNVEYSTEGMKVEGLQVSYDNEVAMLQWSSPACLQYLDYMTFLGNVYYTGGFDRWGIRFPSSNLTPYSGMKATSVATYFYTDGEYTVNIYQCTGNTPSGNPIASVSDTYTVGWRTITFDEFTIDTSKDLWIFFQCSGIDAPTIVGQQSVEEGNYYYSNGQLNHFTGYAFFVSANLTDGVFCYNLYRNGTKIAENLNANKYNDSLPENNTANFYTVKLQREEVESDPSNWTCITKGTAQISGDLAFDIDNTMLLTENSTLTVTGTLSNSYEACLIIENGAQLIHNSADVKATVKKDIAPYNSDQDGWIFIASPVIETIEPSEDNGLLSGNYDLFLYEEPSHMWRNHKEHIVDGTNQNTASGFSINHKQGYLYANESPTTLYFSGTLAPSNVEVSVTDLSHNAETLNGFNLVGNPFVCNATVNTDYYIIDTNNAVSLPPNDHVIAPCEGVFVKASESNNYQVAFSKASANARANNTSNCIDLVISQDCSTLDRARVRLGEGTNMEKFTLDNAEGTQLTFWHDGQDYAVAYTNGQSELPLNFKASENGTYSIGIEANSLDLDYLHLIDNMTGNDIDLLATPNYTFEANTADYASRFRLVFNANDASTGSASFAFVSNGEIVITADASDASLQVVDVMGHVIASYGGHTRCVPTSGIPTGIYVLHLLDGDNIKTQKIVIE